MSTAIGNKNLKERALYKKNPVKRGFYTICDWHSRGKTQGVEKENDVARDHFDVTQHKILEPGYVRIGVGLQAPNSQSRQLILYLSMLSTIHIT